MAVTKQGVSLGDGENVPELTVMMAVQLGEPTHSPVCSK